MDKFTLPPDRHFGFLLAFCVSVVAAWFVIQGTHQKGLIWIAVGMGILFAAVTVPQMFRPFNWLWMKVGFLIGLVVSPLILLLLYYLIITPIALASRFASRDELSLKTHNGKTYWANREAIKYDDDWFINQF